MKLKEQVLDREGVDLVSMEQEADIEKVIQFSKCGGFKTLGQIFYTSSSRGRIPSPRTRGKPLTTLTNQVW